VTTNDDGGQGRNCRLSFSLPGNQTYYIQVESYQGRSQGDYGAYFKAKSKTLSEINYRVATCPLNKAVCSHSEMKEINLSRNPGRISTSKTFAVIVKPTNGKSLNNVTAALTDGWGKRVLVNKILKPGTHTLLDQTAWVVIFDWQDLGTAGVRTERQYDWTAEVVAWWENNGVATITHGVTISD